MRRAVSGLVACTMMLAACSGPPGQVSNQTQTTAEGAGIGVLVGAGLGALIGGKQGALLGAGLGGAAGGLTGLYVASQKTKYATIEQRIAGERAVSAQATATARSQTAASAARLRVVDAQLADLRQMQGDRTQAQQTAGAMLADLKSQRARLEASKQDLETRIKNQQAFITETQNEIGDNDPRRTAELRQWKSEIPAMQEVVVAMTNQIADVSAMETKVQNSGTACC